MVEGEGIKGVEKAKSIKSVMKRGEYRRRDASLLLVVMRENS